MVKITHTILRIDNRGQETTVIEVEEITAKDACVELSTVLDAIDRKEG